MAPLVDEMLQRIAAEVARYERVITYWPVFGPALEGAVCASLRETTASVTRQCGLAQVASRFCLSSLMTCLDSYNSPDLAGRQSLRCLLPDVTDVT